MFEGNDGSEGASQLTAEVLQQAQGVDNASMRAEAEQPQDGETQNMKAETQEGEKEGAEQQVEKTQEDKLFASKFAALTRKEKQLRQQEQEINRRMQELEQKLEAMNKPAPAEEEEPFDIAVRKNPLEALKKKYDLDYETLTNIALNDGKLPVEMQLKLIQEQLDNKYSSELEKLRNELAEKEKSAEEKRHEEVIRNFKNQINDEILSNPTDYELINANREDNVELVYEVIEEHYKQTEAEGEAEIMDVRTAAALVEEHLVEEAKKYLEKSKIQKLVGAFQKTENVKPKETKSQESVTLSNSQSQTSNTGERWLSDEESKREAAKLIRWIED